MVPFMLRKNWARLTETNTLCGYIDTILRGYSQIIFCDNTLTGLIVLISFVDSPMSGLLSLAGSTSALITAVLIRTEPYLVKSGLFGVNGALVGLALAFYLPVGTMLLCVLVIASVLSTIFMRFLLNTLSLKFNLPALSIPFLVVTWLGMLSLRFIPSDYLNAYDLPQYLIGGQINNVLVSFLPHPIVTTFHTLSGIYFQRDVFIGLLALLGILIYSRISSIFGLLGGIIGILLYNLFTPIGGDYAKELNIGFSCTLIGIAFGGFFLRLNWKCVIYALIAICAGAVIGLLLFNLLDIIAILPLYSLFNLVTLLFLGILRISPDKARQAGLEAIPLAQVDRPEANMKWYSSVNKIKHRVTLSLPFSGVWYVSSGNITKGTHSGSGAYAWDFVVVDRHTKLCRFPGAENEDYYSFGLPVLAPAPGIVVKLTGSVPDNTPTATNWEQSWGNYVIIDHGNSEFSEISHFRQDSIMVREGDKVVTGQLLGYCGNSGLSISPHIHYQLQNVGGLGASTLPAKFSSYVLHKGSTQLVVKKGIPREKEFVSNSSCTGS